MVSYLRLFRRSGRMIRITPGSSRNMWRIVFGAIPARRPSASGVKLWVGVAIFALIKG